MNSLDCTRVQSRLHASPSHRVQFPLLTYKVECNRTCTCFQLRYLQESQFQVRNVSVRCATSSFRGVARSAGGQSSARMEVVLGQGCRRPTHTTQLRETPCGSGRLESCTGRGSGVKGQDRWLSLIESAIQAEGREGTTRHTGSG